MEHSWVTCVNRIPISEAGPSMQTDNPQARDIAQQELRDVLASTEALLAALGDQGGEAIDELRARLTTTISDVKRSWVLLSLPAPAKKSLRPATP